MLAKMAQFIHWLRFFGEGSSPTLRRIGLQAWHSQMGHRATPRICASTSTHLWNGGDPSNLKQMDEDTGDHKFGPTFTHPPSFPARMCPQGASPKQVRCAACFRKNIWGTTSRVDKKTDGSVRQRSHPQQRSSIEIIASILRTLRFEGFRAPGIIDTRPTPRSRLHPMAC